MNKIIKINIIVLIIFSSMIISCSGNSDSSDQQQVSVPVFSVNSGTYQIGQKVEITTETDGASIKYTVDGSDPSDTNGIDYTSAINLTQSVTIKAQAFKDGYKKSTITGESYIIPDTVANPVITPDNIYHTTSTTVKISCLTPDSVIRYTIDDSNPSRSHGTIYTSSINITSNTKIKAIAYLEALNVSTDSDIVEKNYIITGKVAKPVLSRTGGSYPAAFYVEITTTTSDAIIKYTTDGSNPTRINGNTYSSSILISNTMNLKAIAYVDAWESSSDSDTTNASYIINGTVANPTYEPTDDTYDSIQYITLKTATSGASIRYTTDGTDPSSTTGNLYYYSFSINSTTTVKAIAYKSGWGDSEVITKKYTLRVKAPVILPDGGEYDKPTDVTITTPTSGASIRFTVDGTVPTRDHGILYSGPFKSPEGIYQIQAIAYYGSISDSEVTTSQVFTVHGPVYNWTGTIYKNTWGAGTDITVNDIKTSSNNDLYITGSFNGDTDFDPGESTDIKTTADSNTNAFLTKINNDGTYGWTMVFTGRYSEGIKLVIDKTDNIFIMGNFSFEIDLDPTGNTDQITGKSDNIFLVRINSDGTYGGKLTWGNESSDQLSIHINALTIDENNDLIFVGTFAYTGDFDPTSGTDTRTATVWTINSYVTKVSSGFSYLWTKTYGGESTGSTSNIYDIKCDSSGNVYLNGSFHGTVDFDPGSGKANKTASSNDIYILKLNGEGIYQNAFIFNKLYNSYWGFSPRIAIDSSGNIFMAGCYTGAIDFDPTSGTDTRTATGAYDIFITKLLPDGSYCWTYNIGTSDPSEKANDTATGIVVDSSGDIYITGSFEYTADFDAGSSVETHSAVDEDDIFMMKLNQDGTYKWSKIIGGVKPDYATGLCLDAAGDIFITGYFNGTVDFNPTVSTDNRTALNDTFWDIFYIKFNQF